MNLYLFYIGLTPLHVACIYLQEAMVDFFLGYLEAEGNLAQEAKAETLELLGASLGIYSGYKYLSEAWKVYLLHFYQYRHFHYINLNITQL